MTGDLVELMGARDAAIAVAADHAEGVQPGWNGQAYILLATFARSANRPFMAEEVRRYALECGLGAPPDPRAWGGVFQKASRAGLIVQAGFTTSRNRQAHMRPTAQWERAA